MLPPYLDGLDPDDVEAEEYRPSFDPYRHASDVWFDRREAGQHYEDDPDDDDYFPVMPQYPEFL